MCLIYHDLVDGDKEDEDEDYSFASDFHLHSHDTKVKSRCSYFEFLNRIQHAGRAVHNITSQIWPFSLRVKIHARSCPLSEIGQTTTESETKNQVSVYCFLVK